MPKKYVKVIYPSWVSSVRVVMGQVYEFEDDGTVERWEEAGIGEFSTEAVFKAQQNLAREERAVTRAAATPAEETAEAETAPEAARAITRGTSPGAK